MSETRTFLLEIGVEEIPASYLEPAVSALSDELGKSLREAGVSFGEVKRMWTPRRLSLIIQNILAQSEEKVEERQGPPAKVAKDEKGNWTIAAKKFAESLGVDESALYIKESGKASYVCAKSKTGGEYTRDILSRILPGILNNLPFPKNMKWPQSTGIAFARPIRWLCALFGDEVVAFEFAGLKSSNITCGHRFAHPEPITIKNPDEYVQKLRDGYVLVDREERKAQVIKGLSERAKELGGKPVPNEELVEEVTDLVEYPKVLDCHLGGFTELPREVLETALAKHQRAFVVEKKAKLLPYFLVVTNAPKLDPELVRPWFERMAVSRLEDAEFFIKEDLEKGLEALVREEPRVEWIRGIGTLADKTRWLRELGKLIAPPSGFDMKTYERAAHLAKADLLSNLVREKEFTSLQGIAGAIYAERLGENQEVCNPIREQYTDTPSSPSSPESAILAISDRLLNIAATFIVGKPPRGSSDPFALRRQATAILKILIDRKLLVGLDFGIEKTLHLLGRGTSYQTEIENFFKDRLKLLLESQGFPYDWVDSVLAVKPDEPYRAWLRLCAFRELNKVDEFKKVAVGQKRVQNILKSTTLAGSEGPEPRLFQEAAELELWDKYELMHRDFVEALSRKDYKRGLDLLLSLRPFIDKFFDEVFVMVDDNAIRVNRLRLLRSIGLEFTFIADFSRIVVESNNP